jgi:uncharacterized membrane protein YedE/YeeE
MASKLNTVEGISNGTTVTAGNSGGASGNAWQSTSSAGATLASDNTHAAHGTQSVKIATTASATSSVTWTLTASLTWWFRVYIWVDSIVAASNPSIIRIRGGSDSIQAMRVTFSDTRHLQIRDGGNSLVSTMTGVFAFGAWYRVEGFCTPGTGAATGAGEIKLFLADSTTTVTSGTLTTSGQNFNGTTLTSGNIDAFNYGQVAAMTSLPAEWFDDFAASNVNYVGPQVQTLSPASIASLEAFGTVAVTPGSKSLSPASIASLESFGAPTIIPGSKILSPTSIASLEVFGLPASLAGAVILHPASIPTAEAFGTPTETPGRRTLSPASIPTAESFGLPASLAGAAILHPSSIGSAESFGAPTSVPGRVTLAPASIPTSEAFGTPGEAPGRVSLPPASIVSAESFGTPSASVGAVTLNPGSIPSEESFGTPTISPVFDTITLFPPSIDSQEAFGQVIAARISPGRGACCTGEQFRTACCTDGHPDDEEEDD